MLKENIFDSTICEKKKKRKKQGSIGINRPMYLPLRSECSFLLKYSVKQTGKNGSSTRKHFLRQALTKWNKFKSK